MTVIELSAPLPHGVSTETAVSVLQDHDFILRCDKNLVSYSEETKDKLETVDPALEPVGPTKCYSCQDEIKNVPANLWKPKTETHSEYTNIKNGLYVHSHSPLSIQMKIVFKVEGGSVIMNTEILATAMLIPIIKGSVKENVETLHAAIMAKLGA